MINKKVNCIIPAYNVGRYLLDAVNSVVMQTFGFEYINLVIVNDGSTDDTAEVVKNLTVLFPEIIYIYQDNGGVSSARNAGLDFCKEKSLATYTCFLDGDDKYDFRQIQVLYDFLEKHATVEDESDITNEDFNSSPQAPDVVFLPVKWFEKQDSIHIAYTWFDRGRTRIIDLNEENFHFNHSPAALFRSDAISDIRFDENLRISEDADFILQLVIRNSRVGWINEGIYYNYRKRIDASSAIDNSAYDETFYMRPFYQYQKFLNYIKTLGYVPRCVQSSVLYDIHWYYEIDETKQNPIENCIDVNVPEALEYVKHLIQHMDNDILEQSYLPYWCRAFLKYLKYGNIHIRNVKNEIFPMVYFDNLPFESVGGAVSTYFVTQRNYKLHIKGFFVKSSFEGVKLIAKFDGNEISATLTPSKYNGRNFFYGQEIFYSSEFEFNIDLAKLQNEHSYELKLFFKYADKYCPANMDHTWFSRLYKGNKFFFGDNAVISKRPAANVLKVETLKDQHIFQFLHDRKKEFQDNYLLEKYAEYFDSYRYKRIWLFIDRHNQMGDNAEALFRYCCNLKDGVDKYMVIPNGSYYKNFEGVNPNIIIYGSFEYKFLLLFAEKYISSTTFFDSNVDTIIPKEEYRRITNTLSNFEEVFLQHGITQNKNIMKTYLNSMRREFSLFTAASSKEYESIIKYSGFSDNVVKLTGLCRFDLLKNNPEKIITISFTWRVALGNIDNREYMPNFKESTYFKMYNDLISDSRLLKNLEKFGFRLIVKLHPNLYIQKEDFVVSEGVELIENEISYSELYEKSSLMVSDVSSMLFDFAYLKKPIIYYQDIAVPLNYGDNDPETFCFKNDGFGEVVDNREECVDKIIDYMQSNCKMEEKYKERVDSYFEYFDNRNCERVYNELINLPARKRKLL